MKALNNFFVSSALILSTIAAGVELPNHPRNQTTLDRQRSPNDFGHIHDAYISYKYVGGNVMIVTFSVPNLSHDKEFYFLKVAANNDSVRARFSANKTEFLHGKGNTLWLGNKKGRSYFVMKISNIYNLNGPYTIYAKYSGRNVPIQFSLKPKPKKLK
ncbi:hypothetical protein N9D31_02585 [Oligoflexaceae bacterium]|nr:hypothetical protein [Oligoflexaceae bacterium]